MNRMTLAALSAAVAMYAGAAAAQQDMSQVQIKTTDLGNKTYMLEGNGGNMTVAVGDDAILLVDTEFAPLHDKIKAAITAISPLPVRTVVNTHYHGDHTGGDEAFAKEGATLVGHENLKKRLAEGTTNALTGAKTAPVTGAALPGKTYTDNVSVDLKGRKVQIGHIANAHTDGDSFIYFADANVLATGDIVSLGARFPNIDVAVGGNLKGMIAGVDSYLKMINDNTKVVPGHGPLTNKAGVMDYRDMLVTVQGRVQKLISEGKTEDQAVAAKPLADIGAKLGTNDMANDNFVKLSYRSLKN